MEAWGRWCNHCRGVGQCQLCKGHDGRVALAESLGTSWAENVRERVTTTEPWPDWSESHKVRAQAERMLGDPCDDLDEKERLVRICYEAAKERWRQLASADQPRNRRRSR
jgi:hypothetical protein